MANIRLGEKKRSGRKLVSDFRRIATTRMLNRIFTYLQIVESAHKTEIVKNICSVTNTRLINDALLWMVNHKLITKEHKYRSKRSNSVNYYSINKKYWKLYNEK